MNDLIKRLQERECKFCDEGAAALIAKDAEIARLQEHLKAVRLAIEESWHRVQMALSAGEGQ